MNRFLSFFLAACLSSALYAQQDMELTATEVAARMAPGWNLGNTLEAGNSANNFTNKGGLGAETSWQGTKTTQDVIDYVKAQGFRSVRIPCAWVMGHISDAANYTIDGNWMARVKEIVDYCINDGLYVVINDHWDGGWLENNIGNTTAKVRNTEILKTLWTQIATAFRDYDEHLLFAGLNEPNNDDSKAKAETAYLQDYEQAFIDAVRATGGNNARRILVVQGPGTNIDKTCNYFDMAKFTDTAADRLMVEIHYYDPWQFWGMEKDESWGKVFYYWGKDNHVSGSGHNATWGEESYMKEELQKLKTKFVDNGVPVLIGEFGANWRTITGSGESQEKHNASIQYHYEQLFTLSMQMGMVPMAWDTNYAGRPSMTIINRSSKTIYNQYMMNGIKAAITAGIPQVNAAVSSKDIYDIFGRKLADKTLAAGIYINNGRKYIVK